MTDLIYLEDSYQKEFGAKVVEVEDNWVALDRTCFYPEGGGQHTDKGILIHGERTVPVERVEKRGDLVWHQVEGEVPEGAMVTGRVDWDRRYAHMRYHTAQHMLSAVFLDEFNARTKGNEIYTDHARMDFEVGHLSADTIRGVEGIVNDWAERDVEVKSYFLPRKEAVKELDPDRVRIDLLPRSIQSLRIVEIPGLDKCPCGGTHVSRTGEVGTLVITRTKSKGRARRRVEFELRR